MTETNDSKLADELKDPNGRGRLIWLQAIFGRFRVHLIPSFKRWHKNGCPFWLDKAGNPRKPQRVVLMFKHKGRPDRIYALLQEIKDITKARAKSFRVDRKWPTLSEASREFGFHEATLRKFTRRVHPFLGVKIQRGPWRYVPHPTRTARKMTVSRDQLKKIHREFLHPTKRTGWASSPEVSDDFGFASSLLLGWQQHGCHYLRKGEKLTAVKHWTVKKNGLPAELWYYRRPQLRRIQGIFGRRDQRRLGYADHQGTWLPSKEYAEALGIHARILHEASKLIRREIGFRIPSKLIPLAPLRATARRSEVIGHLWIDAAGNDLIDKIRARTSTDRSDDEPFTPTLKSEKHRRQSGGRGPAYDPKKDDNLKAIWDTGAYRTHDELDREKELEPGTVKATLKRIGSRNQKQSN